ncbi:MAG: HNH endonuclease family protein, partial [Galactobacter sp.]
VKGKAPMTGYDRETKFGPAWKDLDRNGCDTRNDVLARDLNQIEYKPGTRDCVVASGQLDPEPYTGQSIDFVRGPDSSKVQIDHLVALGNVWVSGGQQLTQDQREAIANDPENLLAVDGPANGAKQDKNAAEWLPPAKDYRCSYVAGQIQVKTKYSLSITSAEKAAMDRILTSCTN